MTVQATSEPVKFRGNAGIAASIVAVGGVLWWLSTYHPAAMPVWAPFDFSWGWFLATAFALLWYVRGLALAEPEARPALWRSALFLAGVGLIYAVLQTRFEYYAQHMFFLNRVQHIVMHHLGPFLIALAWPGETLMRGMPAWLKRAVARPAVATVMRVVQQPVLAAVLFVGLIALWLIPSVHFVAMIDPRLYALMNWSMVVDGILFWCLILDPRPSPPAFCSFPVRIVTVVLVMFPQIAMGAMITFSGQDLYGFYAWCGRIIPSIGAIGDQQFGGLIIWIPAAMMSVVALLAVVNTMRLNEIEDHNDDTDNTSRGPVISASSWTGG